MIIIDLYINKSATFSKKLKVYANGSLVDLSDYSFTFNMETCTSDYYPTGVVTKTLHKDEPNDYIEIYLDYGETSRLCPGVYEYEILMSDVFTKDKIIKGSVYIDGSIK